MTFTRKDLILLQKYKDDNYRKALVDSVVSIAKHQVYTAARNGYTAAQTVKSWADDRREAESLQKEEQQVRDILKAEFPDSKVEVEVIFTSMIFYETVEIVVKVNWGSL